MKTIEVITLDKQGYETHRRDFDTIKDAKRFIKEAALTRGYWERLAESEDPTWPESNAHTIQLHVDGEIHSDWFPFANGGRV